MPIRNLQATIDPARIRQSARRYVGKYTLRAAGRMAPGLLSEAIVILATPRSGSTWLMEVLHRKDGYRAYSEPLLYPEAREAGFAWRPFLEPDEESPEQLEFLRAVLTGTGGSPRGWRFHRDGRMSQLVEFVRNRSVLAKFCRGGRLARWMLRRLELRGAVYLIRHPCAVIASMLNHGAWDPEEWDEDELRENLTRPGTLPEKLERRFAPAIRSVTTWTELLAAMWAIDHYIPLYYGRPETYPWIIVPYERLVLESAKQLERISDYLALTPTTKMRDRLSVASSTVVDQVHDESRRQLSKWQRTLTAEQVDSILRVTRAFGVDLYSEKLEPEYARLNALQSRSARPVAVTQATGGA